MPARVFWALSLLTGATCLSACAHVAGRPAWDTGRARVASVRVIAAPGANADTATALDLVFVYDTSARSLIPNNAADWFARKPALVNGLGRSGDVVSLQVPPASTLDPVKLPSRHARATAVYAFARYLDSAGRKRIDLSRYDHPTLWLTASSVSVSEP